MRNFVSRCLGMLLMLVAWGAQAGESKGKVLVILSSATELTLKDGKKYPTGYYFNEFTVPVRNLVEAGYTIDIATPTGNPATMDEHSLSASYFENNEAKFADYRKFHEGIKELKAPKKISDVISSGLEPYVGLFIPGGHAPMEDLLKDPDLNKVLLHFHAQSKPTAMICHGPIALLAALPNAKAFTLALAQGKTGNAKGVAKKDWIYRGYRMTIFSMDEEKVAEAGQLKGKVFFYPDTALIAAGGKVNTAAKWKSNAIRDRELITGQNPNSDGQLSELFLAALKEKAPVAGR